MSGARVPRKVARAVLEAAMTSEPVRAALAKRATDIAARANSIGQAAGVDVNARVREGTRPKGRPFAYVESPNVAQEYGDATTERLRALGRAGHGG